LGGSDSPSIRPSKTPPELFSWLSNAMGSPCRRIR
jgi:hypothetical protein